MKTQATLLWGAAMGGLGVAIGAFGAHALRPMLEAAGRTDTFELAVRYQFYHALAILATGVIAYHVDSRLLRFSSLCFLIGIFIFSGSLYVLCFSGVTILGAITPVGGMFFILGWTLLFLSVYKKNKPPK
jgi:uncharacterized membrane protein YgdD (TMEM256/DUF423 family)